ncbi:hypothetical protein JQY51_001156 [Salmonella enterica subsp. enterica serovar Cerro]|nr:hypothetical protein [Salmonella enterica subsp. enterica serovar Cerro]EIX0193202.1 hypothetical protein [Salmonella enterica]HAK6378295.1 hypothetical protein [Salmonella enterica]HAK6446472.1 hypothetical protein [Salmonella enterica]HAK7066381.1 hypothetical protein [Salmonella enterica]
MSNPAKENNTTPAWMRPTRKLTEAERKELRDAISGYVGRRKAEGVRMNHTDFLRYQAESVKRASMPPVAKHSQTKTNQPQKEAA